MITNDAETGIGKRWEWKREKFEEKEESCLTNLLGVSVEYLD